MTHPDRAALMREAAIELCESAQHDDPPLSPLDCAMAIRRLPLPPPTDDAQPEPVSVVDVYPDAATRERRRAEMQNAEASVAPVSADDARKLAMAVEALRPFAAKLDLFNLGDPRHVIQPTYVKRTDVEAAYRALAAIEGKKQC